MSRASPPCVRELLTCRHSRTRSSIILKTVKVTPRMIPLPDRAERRNEDQTLRDRHARSEEGSDESKGLGEVWRGSSGLLFSGGISHDRPRSRQREMPRFKGKSTGPGRTGFRALQGRAFRRAFHDRMFRADLLGDSLHFLGIRSAWIGGSRVKAAKSESFRGPRTVAEKSGTPRALGRTCQITVCRGAPPGRRGASQPRHAY